jgi:hypothetical protein
VYDLTDIPFTTNGPLSFVVGTDPNTNDPAIIATTYLSWTGGNGTGFANAANWNTGTIVPSVADSALFNNGAGGTISGMGTVEQLGFYNSGTWVLAAGTSLSAAEQLYVGAGGVGGTLGLGALTIGTGSAASSAGYIYVGVGTGANGMLTISAPAQFWSPARPRYSIFRTMASTSATTAAAAMSRCRRVGQHLLPATPMCPSQ